MDTPDSPAEKPATEAPAEFRWWRVLLVVSLVVISYNLIFPGRAAKPKEVIARLEAINNCRRIHSALFHFVGEYGRYPGPETIDEVRKSTGTLIPLDASSSNSYLRQLIAAGADEKIFDSRLKRFRTPDGRVDGRHALEKGECGFAYVVGLGMSGNPSMPVLIGPVIPGEKRFDPKPFDRKAVVLRMDGSATSLMINIHGHISLGGGKSIDPAKPEWEGMPLTIVWPE